MITSVLRSVLTPTTLVRLALPWLGVFAASFAEPLLHEAALPTLLVALAAIVGIILIAAFGVVSQAEALAHRLGEPYGTLILTLSVVIIEVVLIASVMLGPGDHAEIARDSVTAVMMIIMGLVLGTSLIVGGIRHPHARHNRVGTGLCVALITVFVAISLILPAVLGGSGSFTPAQAVIVIVVIVAVYAFFLVRQTGRQAADFRDSTTADAPVARATRADVPELVARAVVLIATMLPIVLLGHSLAAALDDTLDILQAPAALSGVIIAFIVFTPETITMVRAAAGGEPQRVANLGLGAFVSTLGLTIPSVLVIGLLTGQSVPLAESPAMILVLVATIATTAVTYAAKRTTAVHGAVHIALFAAYLLVLLG